MFLPDMPTICSVHLYAISLLSHTANAVYTIISSYTSHVLFKIVSSSELLLWVSSGVQQLKSLPASGRLAAVLSCAYYSAALSMSSSVSGFSNNCCIELQLNVF